MGLAREANDYTFAALPSAMLRAGSAGLDRKALWFQIKKDSSPDESFLGTVLFHGLAPSLDRKGDRVHTVVIVGPAR